MWQSHKHIKLNNTFKSLLIIRFWLTYGYYTTSSVARRALNIFVHILTIQYLNCLSKTIYKTFSCNTRFTRFIRRKSWWLFLMMVCPDVQNGLTLIALNECPSLDHKKPFLFPFLTWVTSSLKPFSMKKEMMLMMMIGEWS